MGVYMLMSRDSFARFRKSDLFKEMLKDIGSYSDQEINGSGVDDHGARRFWRASNQHINSKSGDLENVESVYSRRKLQEAPASVGTNAQADTTPPTLRPRGGTT